MPVSNHAGFSSAGNIHCEPDKRKLIDRHFLGNTEEAEGHVPRLFLGTLLPRTDLSVLSQHSPSALSVLHTVFQVSRAQQKKQVLEAKE